MSDVSTQRHSAGKDEGRQSGFHLFSGGPLYRMAFRTGVLVQGEQSLIRLGVVFSCITWIPLLALVVVHQYTSGSGAKSFALSLGTHVRFLLAIPIFFAVEKWAGPRLRSCVTNLVESGVVPPEEQKALLAAERTAMRRRDSLLAELLLALAAVITISAGVRGDVPDTISNWRMTDGFYTPAGWWYAVVSIFIFQFLFWRWCWTIFIWNAFLYRVSRLKLRLVPTHPDFCGGLGYAAVAQTYLSAISIATSSVIAASIGEQILNTGVSPPSFLPIMLGVTGISLIVFLGPLLFFAARMFEVKRRGYREYGILASRYTRLFDDKWVHGSPGTGDPLLGSADIQSLADLANAFNVVRNMRLVPFGVGIFLNIVLFAIGPTVPLLLFKFSVNELIMRIAKLLLGM